MKKRRRIVSINYFFVNQCLQSIENARLRRAAGPSFGSRFTCGCRLKFERKKPEYTISMNRFKY